MWQLRDYAGELWNITRFNGVHNITYWVVEDPPLIHGIPQLLPMTDKTACDPKTDIYVKLTVLAFATKDEVDYFGDAFKIWPGPDLPEIKMTFFLDQNRVYFWGGWGDSTTYYLKKVLSRMVVDLSLIRAIRGEVEKWSLQP